MILQINENENLKVYVGRYNTYITFLKKMTIQLASVQSLNRSVVKKFV